MARYDVLISICASYETLEAPEDGLNVHVVQRQVRDALKGFAIPDLEIDSINVSRED